MQIGFHVGGQDTVSRNEKWLSHKEISSKFDEEELERHITSGRVLWREDPLTKGVWQYKDQGDVSRTTTVHRGKNLSWQQEWEPQEEQVD